MLKEKAVASLGQPSLLMPAWIKAALAANDRLKLYLTLLQSAAQHASTPDGPVGRWETDIAHAGLQDAPWAPEMLSGAYYDDDLLILPHMENLLEALSNDLATMARPLCDADQATLLRGRWDLVCIELGSGKPRRMPEEFCRIYLPALTAQPGG